ncbi:hypothetical protein J437_LFUL005655 [Ladona fulva]|uniref:Uncharacterized protein n=1 Tax=Ladona fulva TaxID=123851 RepID=A0A8K0NYM7_LADFU|nr:hypothetical protein J437_LFUL005655 [Ladona fulva]
MCLSHQNILLIELNGLTALKAMASSKSLDDWKKEWSKSTILDGMKNDMLEELKGSGWTEKMSKELSALQSPDHVTYKDIIFTLCSKHVKSSLSQEEANWENITQELVKTITIPEEVKQNIFQKWRERTQEI